MFGQGQFDDAEDDLEERLAREELVARATASLGNNASALSASRGLGGFGVGGPNASEAAYLSILSGAGDANSPYAAYQRSAYARNPYLQQAGYGAIPSPAESLYAAARARTPSAYGYGSNAPSPADYRSAYGSTPQRDYASYFSGRSAQDLQHTNLMDRIYSNTIQDETDTNLVGVPSSSILGTPASTNYSTSIQGTPGSPPTSSSIPSSASVSAAATPAIKGGRGSGKGGKGGGRGGRGRGRGSGKRRSVPTPSPTPTANDNDSKAILKIDDKFDQKWYNGVVPLGLPEDKYWLSELQVFLRSNFAEAFGANEADIAAPMHGRNKPIALGQVGIRCIHCRNDSPSERGQQATSYPSLISGIYNSVQQMLRLHFDCCLSMPSETRSKIDRLKESSSARGGRKQYWIDSAKRLGLVDTPHGIHFARDPYGPLPPLAGPSAEDEAKLKAKMERETEHDKRLKNAYMEDDVKEVENVPDVEPYPLVQPEDRDLISDYLYLTLEQMQPCNLMEADKVGCYKGRGVGFHGLACKHCVGQAGCGRYFPASEASLSQTTTSQTIMNHVRNCRRCPIDIRENLELMKRARMGSDGKRAEKPKHGGRKVFFHRLWCRIQRIPMSEDIVADGGSAKRRANYASGRKRKSSRPNNRSNGSESGDDDSELDDSDDRINSSDEETDTEDDEGSDDDEIQSAARLLTGASTTGKVKPGSNTNKSENTWYEGRVSLAKTDDPNWLSEIQCFVRSDLVELFSHKEEDCLEGYAGRKEPSVGQVGLRCVFCKALEESERPPGYLYFPDNLSAIHTKVGDMIRLHYPSCPGMPEEMKSTFRSLRGFGAKADDDTQEYWLDSARDIGLSDISPNSSEKGWGIWFRRNPLKPSPADDLDRENEGEEDFDYGSSLLRPEDRGLCTDHAMLLLRQVKPCRFKKSDKRGGPGSRGRDRVIGFPGLCCRHCSSKNSFGRYFPVSAKNLTDNTANSLQAHISSCNRCPENIKASLAYLLHRGTRQKSNLSGSWKKSFFKRIWERLHVERAWSSGGGEDDDKSQTESSIENENYADTPKSDVARLSTNEGDDSEDEEVGEDMTKLIKAAAVWLSEQDVTTDNLALRSRAAPRGRALPSGRRSLPFSAPRARGRGSSLTAKRRRGNSS